MFSFKFRLQHQEIEDVHLLSWIHFQWTHTKWIGAETMRKYAGGNNSLIVYLQVLRYTSDTLSLCDNNSITT